MRQLALLGLVFSLLVGGIAVFEASESVHTARNMQDRSLQAAVSDELSLISGGERQTTTALSLTLVNPAVRQLLSDPALAPGTRRGDLAAVTQGLATIERSSFVPLSAACLENGRGRQLVCVPSKPTAYPLALGRHFLTLAEGSRVGIASGAFLSPVSDRPSVAFLAPLRVGGRVRGLVHLDIGIAAASGSGLLVANPPGVNIQLGAYERGRVLLDGPSTVSGGGRRAPRAIDVGTASLGAHPRWTLNGTHRAMVATLPLAIGEARARLAVAATDVHPDPDLLDAWSPDLLTLLLTAAVTLLASIAGLVVSNRRIVRELSTDALTRLRNRRALMEDLPRACLRASEDDPVYLWFFDLNGFKSYNDSLGHLAGDALLSRLGSRLLDVVAPHGCVYRLGGDEFCALVTGRVEDPHALFQHAREALTEEAGAFTVDASAGAVEIPREARDPAVALRLADQHMYREKSAGRDGAAEPITAVLHDAAAATAVPHATLAERHPDLTAHFGDVAEWPFRPVREGWRRLRETGVQMRAMFRTVPQRPSSLHVGDPRLWEAGDVDFEHGLYAGTSPVVSLRRLHSVPVGGHASAPGVVELRSPAAAGPQKIDAGWILDELTEGLLVHAANGEVVLVNDSASRILGMPKAELEHGKLTAGGVHLVDADESPLREDAFPTIMSLRSGRDQIGVMIGIVRHDCATRWICVNSRALCRQGDMTPYAAVACFSDVTAHQEALRELNAARFENLKRLALVSEYRDDDTQRHTERVARTSTLLAQQLGLDSETVATLARAAPLHDVGKIGIPDWILLKPARLTEDELLTMRTHTTIGAHILMDSNSPILRMASEIALSHHERWDGAGYPSGLAGESIPLTGRIVAVADAFDAMVHTRPYKGPTPVREAVAEIARCSAGQFDPRVVQAFLTLDHDQLVDPQSTADELPRPSATIGGSRAA